jgi:hypothetical protein
MTAEFYPDDALRSTESRSAESGLAPIASAGLALLAELEATLQASQRALLAHDVASLEQSTGEQIRLRRVLEIKPPNGAPRAGSELSHSSPQFAAELRAARRRVLHLGQVQVALLGRAQRWLRTLSHLTAGPGASYSAALGRRGPQYTASPDAIRGASADLSASLQAEEPDPCRA